jgi:hypothetical protein
MASAGITLLAALLKWVSRQRTKYPEKIQAQWRNHLYEYHQKLLKARVLTRSRQSSRLEIRRVTNSRFEHSIEKERSHLKLQLYKRTSRRVAIILDETFLSLIIGLADQQVVIAFAVLIAARVQWDTISAYHFNIISILAWFSCFTHAITLLTLMYWMKESKPLLFLRLSLFTAVFLMWLWAQAMARDYQDGSQGTDAFIGQRAACPARCCLSDSWSTSNGLFRLICLVLVLAVVAWNLFRHLTHKTNHLASTSAPTKKNTEQLSLLIIAFILFFALNTAMMYTILFDSATMRNVSAYTGLIASQAFEDQNIWGFGQIVPMVLLILPVLAAFEGYIGKSTFFLRFSCNG